MIDFPSGSVFLTNEILKKRTLLLRMKPNIRAPIFPNTVVARHVHRGTIYLFYLNRLLSILFTFSPRDTE